MNLNGVKWGEEHHWHFHEMTDKIVEMHNTIKRILIRTRVMIGHEHYHVPRHTGMNSSVKIIRATETYSNLPLKYAHVYVCKFFDKYEGSYFII